MQLTTLLPRRFRALPLWCKIALPAPQELIRVNFLSREREFEVTSNCVIAALRPLTVGVGFGERTDAGIDGSRLTNPRLEFIDRKSGRTLGVLGLRFSEEWATAARIGLFEVTLGEQACIGPLSWAWNRWLQDRAARKQSDRHNFSIAADAAAQIAIFYICPRPVVLTSVDDGRHSNLFPMDLIGPLATGFFALALRTTSPSVATMQAARKVAISDIAARDHAIAYRLGAHHREANIDLAALPFAVERSKRFSLPVPARALRVRELEIVDARVVGSHHYFLTRIATDSLSDNDARLFHTSGIHRAFRQREKPPLQAV